MFFSLPSIGTHSRTLRGFSVKTVQFCLASVSSLIYIKGAVLQNSFWFIYLINSVVEKIQYHCCLFAPSSPIKYLPHIFIFHSSVDGIQVASDFVSISNILRNILIHAFSCSQESVSLLRNKIAKIVGRIIFNFTISPLKMSSLLAMHNDSNLATCLLLLDVCSCLMLSASARSSGSYHLSQAQGSVRCPLSMIL